MVKTVMVWVCAMNLYNLSKAGLPLSRISSAFVLICFSWGLSLIFQEKLKWILEQTNLSKWSNQQAYLVNGADHTETHLYLIGVTVLLGVLW